MTIDDAMKPISEPFDPVKHKDVKPWKDAIVCSVVAEGIICGRICPDLEMKLSTALAAMRKDGQGLSLDQETTIRRGLGLI